MKVTYGTSYPDGIEAIKCKDKGRMCWVIIYTPLHTINAKERTLGLVIQERDAVYTIPGKDHPPLQSKCRAVWWLYTVETGGVDTNRYEGENDLE
jgi:hypothetical protein